MDAIYLQQLDLELEQLYRSKVNFEIQLSQVSNNVLYDSNLRVIYKDWHVIIDVLDSNDIYRIKYNKTSKIKRSEKLNLWIISLIIKYSVNKLSLVDFINALSSFSTSEVKIIESKITDKDWLLSYYLNSVIVNQDLGSQDDINNIKRRIEQTETLIASKQSKREQLVWSVYIFEVQSSKSWLEVNFWWSTSNVKDYSDIVRYAEEAGKLKDWEKIDKSKEADTAKHSETAKHAEESDKARHSDTAKHADESDKAKHSETATHAWDSDRSKHAEWTNYARESEKAKFAERVDEKYIEEMIKKTLKNSEAESDSRSIITKYISSQDSIESDDEFSDSFSKTEWWERKWATQEKVEVEGIKINQDFSKILEESNELLSLHRELKEKREEKDKSIKTIVITNSQVLSLMFISLILIGIWLFQFWIVNI